MILGGRLLESAVTPGAVPLGAKTIQEGGACESFPREKVELFCIDHMVRELMWKEASYIRDPDRFYSMQVILWFSFR